MKSVTLVFLAAFVAMACAVGQYYVPRAYYLIDSEGHQTPPVPLRRLRRSLRPLPLAMPSWYPGQQGDTASANAIANANPNSYGGDTSASANARASSWSSGSGGSGGWSLPYQGQYGAANPNSAGH